MVNFFQPFLAIYRQKVDLVTAGDESMEGNKDKRAQNMYQSGYIVTEFGIW